VTLAPDLPAGTPQAPPGEDELAYLLKDPEIRASLAVILANAPTLAAMASMSSALLQRGPELMDNINQAVRQVRESVDEDTTESGRKIGTAVGSLADLAPIAPALAARTDVITGFLDSPVLQPEIVEIIGHLGEAAVEADQQTRGRRQTVGGVLSILRELKDPQVQETLAFLFAFAKSFGQRQSAGTSTRG
jgi:hypothetical protein